MSAIFHGSVRGLAASSVSTTLSAPPDPPSSLPTIAPSAIGTADVAEHTADTQLATTPKTFDSSMPDADTHEQCADGESEEGVEFQPHDQRHDDLPDADVPRR